MAQATWAWRPLRGSPWVLKYPYCHQMITQITPGATEGFWKNPNFNPIKSIIQKSKFFQVPLSSLTSVKTANSSLSRGHIGGGWGVGTRPWWLALFLLACGSAYWPLAFEPSAMTSRHPYYCGHPHCRGQGGGTGGTQSSDPGPRHGLGVHVQEKKFCST